MQSTSVLLETVGSGNAAGMAFSQVAGWIAPIQQSRGGYSSRTRAGETSRGCFVLSCLRLLPQVAIGENEFSSAARQRESLQAAHFFRFFLVRPQEYVRWTVPQCRQ